MPFTSTFKHLSWSASLIGSGRTDLGRNLYPRAPDMRQTATQSLSDGELFYIIENGIRLTGMPAWSRPGQEDASWALVHFIRHLPALTPQEELEMQRLNPRGPEEWKELQSMIRSYFLSVVRTKLLPSPTTAVTFGLLE